MADMLQTVPRPSVPVQIARIWTWEPPLRLGSRYDGAIYPRPPGDWEDIEFPALVESDLLYRLAVWMLLRADILLTEERQSLAEAVCTVWPRGGRRNGIRESQRRGRRSNRESDFLALDDFDRGADLNEIAQKMCITPESARQKIARAKQVLNEPCLRDAEPCVYVVDGTEATYWISEAQSATEIAPEPDLRRLDVKLRVRSMVAIADDEGRDREAYLEDVRRRNLRRFADREPRVIDDLMLFALEEALECLRGERVNTVWSSYLARPSSQRACR